MAENTNTEREAFASIGEEQAFEAWFKMDCPVDGINAKLAAKAAWKARASLSLPAAGQEPVAWPQNAAEVRAFVGSHFCSLLYANPVSMEPSDNDRYELTAHDLLSAFRWWTEDAAQQPAEPIAGKEPEAWQERQQTSTGWTPWYDAELPTSMGKGPGLSEVLGGIEYQWRPLYTAQQPATPYSIDADPQGIRATVADAITGALAFGAQGVNKPPEDHWLTPFWEAARASAQPAVAACWVNLPGQLPEPGKPVLLDIGKKYPIRAMWAAKFTLPVSLEDDSGFGEHDERTDEWYCPEGWYEWNEHEETHWAVSATPRAWATLPPTTSAGSGKGE